MESFIDTADVATLPFNVIQRLAANPPAGKEVSAPLTAWRDDLAVNG